MKFSHRLSLGPRQGDNEEAVIISQYSNPRVNASVTMRLQLHEAAYYGDLSTTQYLINRGCNIDAVDNFGNTPLILASQRNKTDVIYALITANASVLTSNNQGKSAAKIILADPSMRYGIIGAVLEKVKKECSNNSLQTAKKLLKLHCPLPRAVILKDTVVTKYMLENGCSVSDRDTDGPQFAALHQAVIYSDLQNVELLVNCGADINIEDRLGRSPLHLARNIQICKFLLDHGAKLITDDGNLVSGHLFQYGDKNTVEMLMQLNLDLFVKDIYGTSLVHYVVLNECFDPVEILKNNLDNSFNINERSFMGSTLLISASIAGNTDTVEFLLNKGANINIVSEDEQAILCYPMMPAKNRAEQIARTKMMVLLLQYRANVQWISSDEQTIFDEALICNSYTMVKFILAHIALMEDLGRKLKDLIHTKINSHGMFISYFSFCKQTIEKFKKKMIKRSVTLFDFLTCDGKKFINFARNEQLVSRVQLMMYHKRSSNLYYHKVLRQRAVKAVQVVNLKKHALHMVSQIRALQNNQIILEKIAGYLIYDDLQVIASCPTFRYLT